MLYALVNKTIGSLRKEPEPGSELVDEVLYGMKVVILKEAGTQWYLIRTHYNYTGYIHKSELLQDDNRILVWDMGNKKIISHSYADILSESRVQGRILMSLTRGAVIEVIEEADENGWVKVSLWNGQIGYAKEKFLGEYVTSWSKKDEDILRKHIINTAMSYLGTQYRWGGKSSLGIDCSGLCSMAYMINGVIIYRDAHMKEGYPVHEIKFEQMQSADLLYFPGHMAMYLGGFRYIHATAKNGSDGVVINSFNPKDPDYREDLPGKLQAVGSIF